MCDAFEFPLGGQLHLLLTPRRSCNGIIGRVIGDALECVRDARQLEGNLVGTARPFQHDDSFSAEVKGGPEQQPSHDGHEHHQCVVTRNGDASSCDGDQMVREQCFPPDWGLRFASEFEIGPPRSGVLRGMVVWTMIA